MACPCGPASGLLRKVYKNPEVSLKVNEKCKSENDDILIIILFIFLNKNYRKQFLHKVLFYLYLLSKGEISFHNLE